MSINFLSFGLSSICLGAVFALPAVANAGEITRSAETNKVQWKSTECPRPVAKQPRAGLAEQDRLMTYARDIEIFIDCIQREAQRDFENAQTEMLAAIERDLARQTEIMNDMMLEAAKTMR